MLCCVENKPKKPLRWLELGGALIGQEEVEEGATGHCEVGSLILEECSGLEWDVRGEAVFVLCNCASHPCVFATAQLIRVM